jgi:hypothetical protein
MHKRGSRKNKPHTYVTKEVEREPDIVILPPTQDTPDTPDQPQDAEYADMPGLDVVPIPKSKEEEDKDKIPVLYSEYEALTQTQAANPEVLSEFRRKMLDKYKVLTVEERNKIMHEKLSEQFDKLSAKYDITSDFFDREMQKYKKALEIEHPVMTEEDRASRIEAEVVKYKKHVEYTYKVSRELEFFQEDIERRYSKDPESADFKNVLDFIVNKTVAEKEVQLRGTSTRDPNFIEQEAQSTLRDIPEDKVPLVRIEPAAESSESPESSEVIVEIDIDDTLKKLEAETRELLSREPERVLKERQNIINDEFKKGKTKVIRRVQVEFMLRDEIRDLYNAHPHKDKSSTKFEIAEKMKKRRNELEKFFIEHGVDPVKHDDQVLKFANKIFKELQEKEKDPQWTHMSSEIKWEYAKMRYEQFSKTFFIQLQYMVKLKMYSERAMRDYLKMCRVRGVMAMNAGSKNEENREKWAQLSADYVAALYKEHAIAHRKHYPPHYITNIRTRMYNDIKKEGDKMFKKYGNLEKQEKWDGFNNLEHIYDFVGELSDGKFDFAALDEATQDALLEALSKYESVS